MIATFLDVAESVGYPLVFALIAIETMGIPVPGETALVTASFDRGVLEISIPKPEERKPRRIEIGGADAPKTIEG